MSGSMHERFAVSLIKQSLVRNGWDVQVGELNTSGPDLIVRAKGKETFRVEVKWISSETSLKRVVHSPHLSRAPNPTYLAVVIGAGSHVIADKGLVSKIKRHFDPKVILEELP